MNSEQVKSGVRWLVSTFGGAVAGFFAGKGWLSADTVLQVLNSEVFLGLLASLAMGAWALVARTEKNQVAAVAEIAKQPDSPVKAVITEDTPEGKDLAAAIPGPVVPAGSVAAKEMAK